MSAEPPCVICRRPEVEHRDRNGHGFVAVEGEPPHRAAWSGNWRDEDNAPAQDGAEVEALAEYLRGIGFWGTHADFGALTGNDDGKRVWTAKALLASDWLAQRDKDRDAAVAAKVAEQIAQDIEAARRVNVAALDQQGKDAYGVGRWYGVNDGLIQAAVIARAAALRAEGGS